MTQTQQSTRTPRMVVIGGVAGGASAATRARRLSEAAEVVIIERGPDVSFANCGLPYHIGEVISDRQRLLVQTPQSLRQRFNLEVHTRTEAVRIDRAAKTVLVRDLVAGTERTERYDYLILSPGAAPVHPPLPGAGLPRVRTLRSMADMDAIKKLIDQEKPAQALIVGGGYIGLEMAEALRLRGVGVILVELARQVMGVVDPEMAAPLHQELRRHGVDLRLGMSVKEFREEKNESQAEGSLVVTLSDGSECRVGLALLAIGVKPEVTLAREAGLTLGPRGGIVVDEQMRTSDPAIFAVGDAVEVQDFITGEPALIPLAGPANRQGRIAADNALGRNSRYKKTQGTAICKVFDLAAGITGLSEKALVRQGRTFEKVYVHPAAHASYYPGAQPLSLKLLFDPANGRVLGAQAVGAEGVDKRIDVLAVALRAGLTVLDLEELELAYAPPFGSAKDPVNYAGFTAANVLRGDVKICHTADLLALRSNQRILDVRTDAEVEMAPLPHALHIPLDHLRERLGELSRDHEYLVTCQVGLRGYLACRILMQHNLACRNLSGGYKTYAMTMAQEGSTPTPPPASPSTPAQAPSACVITCPTSATPVVAREIDATGLACPGPVMRLKQAMEEMTPGESLRIAVTDAGFLHDVPAWCNSTGHKLVALESTRGRHVATIRKRAAAPVSSESPSGLKQHKTIVVFSGDLDKALAALIIANGAAAAGSKVTLFFTFWGLNILRRPEKVATSKGFVERMFGWMMPRGPGKLKLSKMHMGGLGSAMIKGIMQKHRVPPLEALLASAQQAGVRLVACTMTMDLMGFKKEELREGVEFGGVAMYLNQAEAGNVNLFV